MNRTISLPLALVLCAAAGWSVPVEKWVQTTQADFQNGKAEGTAILPLGQVALAPQLKALLAQSVPHIWSLAVDAKGTVYAAAGLPPRVLRLRGGKVDTLFTAPSKSDLEILAVALGPKGGVYAAAAPSGTLYRIAPDGKHTVVYKGGDPYIWALAVAPDGTLHAATGPNGKLLKITPQGKATTVLKAAAKHILCLLRTRDGTLYAGTDQKGLLYRVSPTGQARLVYDAAESDIRALALDRQGQLCFATAAAATTTSTSTATRPTPPRPTIVMSGGRPRIVTSRRPTTSPRPSVSKPSAPGSTLRATNAVYRLARNGSVAKIASVSGVAFFALAWHGDRLYAATGNDGKLYRIEKRRAVQLADLKESQIMALGVAGGRLVLATANPGRIYRVAADHGASGTLLSEVYDTVSLSQWGQAAWQARCPAGASITIATRTGNSSRPDASWSPWSKEYAKPEGQPIASPAARFIQYRATLKRAAKGAAPLLDEVVIAYIRANEAPRITSVKIGKPPKPRRPSTSSAGGKTAKPQTQPVRPLNTRKQPAASQRGPLAERIRILWQAADPNKDGLLYAVYFRGQDETTWKKICDRHTIAYVDWDTEAVPDGLYRFRVVASDALTNPPDHALETDYITQAIIIDNTPPAVGTMKATVAANRTVAVSARATDKGSRLAAGEYSIDAGDWTPLVPVDGIFDGADEALQFKTEPLDKGEHTIVVRVKDEAGNSGAAKAVVRIK